MKRDLYSIFGNEPNILFNTPYFYHMSPRIYESYTAIPVKNICPSTRGLHGPHVFCLRGVGVWVWVRWLERGSKKASQRRRQRVWMKARGREAEGGSERREGVAIATSLAMCVCVYVTLCQCVVACSFEACVKVYVCACACVRACVCECTHAYMCAWCLSERMHVQTRVHVHARAHVRVLVCAWDKKCVFLYVRVFLCACKALTIFTIVALWSKGSYFWWNVSSCHW